MKSGDEMHLLNATRAVLNEVALERIRQEALWGEQNHPDGTGPDVIWLDVLVSPMSHMAAEARYRCQSRARRGKLTYLDILAEEFFEAAEAPEPAHLRDELVQVAAVAVAWIEKLDRDHARVLAAYLGEPRD